MTVIVPTLFRDKFRILALILAGIIFGIIVTYISVKHTRCSSMKYQFINSELSCNKKYSIKKSSYTALRNALQKYIDKETRDKNITEASIYFRDLDNGPTMGIRENTAFAPASLLKVPLLLAYFRFMDNNPDEAETSLGYKLIDDTYKPYFPPQHPIQEGQRYTVEELVEHMIKESDNRAYYLLLQYLKDLSPDRDLLTETYWDLGIVDPENPLEDLVTVKSYASIFTQLYYGSLFPHLETSEKALNILSQTDFHEGLEAGVPKGIRVSHKFGEQNNADGVSQLQDCGIIYYPTNPYLLCVMSRGKDMDKLVQFIQEVSREFYDEIESRKI